MHLPTRLRGRQDRVLVCLLVLLLAGGALWVRAVASLHVIGEAGRPVRGWKLEPRPIPAHLALTPSGMLLVSDATRPEIREYTPGGRDITSWRPHDLRRAQIQPGSQVFVDGRGSLYIPSQDPYDAFTKVVRRFDAAGRYEGTARPPLPPHTFATGALVAVGENRNLYFSTTLPTPGIQEGDLAGHRLTGFGSGCMAASCSASKGQLHELDPMTRLPAAVDRDGNVYVVDSADPAIVKFSPSGAVIAAWGRSGSGPGEFRGPEGIAVDSHGNIYIADTGNNRIQKLSPNGDPLGVTGTRGAKPGQFNAPTDIAVDQTGNVYVLDSGNNRVQKLAPA
jgi:hypothetical protein